MRIQILTLLTLFTLIPAWGQEKREAKSSGGATGEPIKVHGHWLIEIRNPDGKLAMRREIENSLITGTTGAGDDMLSAMLTGAVTPGQWVIQLNVTNSGPTVTYFIVQGGTARGCASCNNLTVSTANSATQIVLQGVFLPITTAGTIQSFGTLMNVCPATVNPTACFTGATFSSDYAFSGTTISGMPVTVGQLVAVTVTLSFS